MSNLRAAPFFLRPSVVRALIHDMDLIARAVKQVPLLPIKLVERPRRSEDPRLSKANDDQNQTLAGSGAKVARPSTGSRALGQESASAPSRKDSSPCAGSNPAPANTSPNPPPRDLTMVDSTSDCQGRAAEVTSGVVAGGPLRALANARQSCANSDLNLGRSPLQEYGQDGMAQKGEVSRNLPVSEASPYPVKVRALRAQRQAQHERTGVLLQPAARRSDGIFRTARRQEDRELETAVDVYLHHGETPRIETIRAAAKKLSAVGKIDWARVAEAHRRAASTPKIQAKATPTEHAPSRESCPRCGIPGWKGCDHYLPCKDELICRDSPHGARHDWPNGDDRKAQKFTGHRQGLSVLRI